MLLMSLTLASFYLSVTLNGNLMSELNQLLLSHRSALKYIFFLHLNVDTYRFFITRCTEKTNDNAVSWSPTRLTHSREMFWMYSACTCQFLSFHLFMCGCGATIHSCVMEFHCFLHYTIQFCAERSTGSSSGCFDSWAYVKFLHYKY